MLKTCLFLEIAPHGAGDAPFRCTAGVNFYSVGFGRELCRTCALAGHDPVLHCKYLDVYTFLQTSAGGTRFVQVEMRCSRPEGALPDEELCAACPGTQARAHVASMADSHAQYQV